MPRRSYLQRIAEPLAGGAPVLFAAPRAAPEDARPPATAPTQTLRRAVATRPTAAASAPTSGRAGLNGAALTTAEAPVPPASPNPASPARVMESVSPFASAAVPHPAVSAADPAVAAAPSSPNSVWPVDVGDAAPPAAPPPAAVFQTDAVTQSEFSLTLPPQPGTDPPRSEASGPRIHIGAVEVRMSPPPAAPTPPPAAATAAPPHALGGASTPVSRAYGWRYGLIQS